MRHLIFITFILLISCVHTSSTNTTKPKEQAPQTQQAQQIQQPPPQKIQNVCIDPAFSLFETIIIQDAFEAWTQYTKVKYHYTNGKDKCYFKVYSVDEALATEAGVPKGIVAFCNKICGNQIFVLYERVPLAFYGTILRHEAGHLLGLNHEEDPDDLMYYRVSTIKFPTQENALKITCNK